MSYGVPHNGIFFTTPLIPTANCHQGEGLAKIARLQNLKLQQETLVGVCTPPEEIPIF